jgi:integrase
MRRRSLGTFGTRREAERAEREALAAKDRGIDLSPRTVTVQELLARFVADRRTKARAVRTVERYEGIVRLLIAPHLGTITVAKLSPAHVSAWIATLQEGGGVGGRPLSAKTAKHAHALLRSALRWAVRHDLASRNVADAVDPPTVGRSRAHALADDEAKRFLEAADQTRWGSFFRIALGTAARRGELLALRWADVSFDAATVTIRHAVVETADPKNRIVEKTTKTDRVRTVPLGALALDALRMQKRTQAENRLRAGGSFADSGHVFQGPLGGPVAPYLATDAFRSLRATLKIDASLHDLRHTAATWMLAGGIDVKTVASVLGHSAASTTLNVYGHVIAGAEARAIIAIDEHLRRVGT